MPTPEVVIAVVIAFLVIAFLIGYTAANTHERRAQEMVRHSLRASEKQKHDLGVWVRKNWPDEFEAYRNGHIEGYQQGVSQAPELEERARMSE